MNIHKTISGIALIALLCMANYSLAQVKDYEGNTYKTVQISNQTWMAENLKVKTFNNGDKIEQAKTVEEWKDAGNEKKPAWCYYENDPTKEAKYGILYNWYAVADKRGIAPEGWKVASKEDWYELHQGLGENYTPKLRTSGEQWYDAPAYQAKNNTNSLNFNANGAGLINAKVGRWFGLRETTYWWTSSEYSESDAIYAVLGSATNNIGIADMESTRTGSSPNKPTSKELGFSLRCIKK